MSPIHYHHLCSAHKEFEPTPSHFSVIGSKNTVFYPIGDLMVRLVCNIDVVICLRMSKIGYIVTRENASIFVSF